jgi:histidyl-tRNA synthetase
VKARFQALKGVEDILPPYIYVWQMLEDAAKGVFSAYGFEEIRPPVIEHTELFVRSVGETTDIVEKEMYTFTDKGGRSVTLRPEGTAPVVRSFVEHNLHTLPSPQKFFYKGPMFRYERPQKGRQRQFYQIGVEAFGVAEPRIDAEVISMLFQYLKKIGLVSLSLELNSIGDEACRPVYKEKLKEYFGTRLSELCPDCQRRFELNPLRILDCKVDRCAELKKNAPLITDYLCQPCRAHFVSLQEYLRMLKVPFTLNPRMVRGLDYYTRTTFEVTTEHLGAQNAVAAGGRYDKLVEDFGGPQTPAIGFALGMERLAALLKERAEIPRPALFIAHIGPSAATDALKLAVELRARGLWVETGYEGASLKSQLRKADRLGARYAFILGEEELKRGVLKWKDLKEGASGEINLAEAFDLIKPA